LHPQKFGCTPKNEGKRVHVPPDEKTCGHAVLMVRAMVFNATFNNISVISWGSILLVEETGVSGENHQQTLSHNVILSTLHHQRDSNSQLQW
jgi:hypothetical protein